jgi:hypothetical protein
MTTRSGRRRFGRRRGLLALGTVIGTAAAFTFLAASASAVHDTGAFELDGNATNNPAVAGDDWDNVCHQVLHNDCSTSNDTSASGGATATAWVAEPNPSVLRLMPPSKNSPLRAPFAGVPLLSVNDHGIVIVFALTMPPKLSLAAAVPQLALVEVPWMRRFAYRNRASVG